MFEVKQWDLEKKLVYQQHYRVEGLLQEKEREEQSAEYNTGDVNLPRKGSVPSRGPSGVGGGGSTQATQHPALARYDSVVNVEGE